MARINLLPWREEQKKKNLNEFGIMILVGLGIAAGIWGGWHWQNEENIAFQKKRNAYVQKEITAVEARIREIEALEKTKQQLIARMNVITELQTSRPLIVRLMDEIVTTLPEGVYLSKVVQNGSNVNFDGSAQSNARVSNYMRNIEATPYMDKPQLAVIQNPNRSSTGYSQFQLSAVQVNPKKKENEQ